MESEASTSVQSFHPGDLIWAKMKGFPPWPAKVLEKTEDTPARRIPVMFFGTLETSFMKPSDLSDYLSNRSVHEIPRKQKDFNKAVQEIRVAAGLLTDQDDTAFPVASKSPPRSPPQGSTRQSNGRFLDAIMSSDTTKRKRSNNSASSKSRSRTSSTASVFKLLRDAMKKDRKRLDSESSHGSKRKMISGGIIGNSSMNNGNDIFDNYADSLDLNNIFGDNLLDIVNQQDDNKSQKSKRSRGSSKIFDDFFLGSRTRNRSGSASGRRSRLISLSAFSGVSDVFDEFFNNADIDLDAHAQQLMLTLDNMPSEGSVERPLSPELLAPQLPPPPEFCNTCGSELGIYNGVWKCNSLHCIRYKEMGSSAESAAGGIIKSEQPNLKIENIKTESVSSGEKTLNNMLMVQPGTSHQLGLVKQEQESPEKKKKGNLVINTKNDSEGKKDKKKRKVQVMSPRSPNSISLQPSKNTDKKSHIDDFIQTAPSSPPRRDRTRPKHYKVEKTPPISATGHRHCVNCNGQVRPQMCGGNRHRWRCVDKKCRKWYGWVRSHEEIPKNVGRKKLNSQSVFKLPSKPMKSRKRDEEEESLYHSGKRKVGRPSKNDIKIRLKLQKEAELRMDASSEGVMNIGRRKYTKRKNKELHGIVKEEAVQNDDTKKRAGSPLSEKEARYRPSAMEKRARWWTGEKRRVDVSPERDFGITSTDSAAAFRMMAHAVRSAAVTRADEMGTVNGTLDLLMDTLMGSMAPLLSLLQSMPRINADPNLLQNIWNSSAIHIPTFQ